MICEEHGNKGNNYYVICRNKAGLETHFKNNEGYEDWTEYNKAESKTHYKDNEGLDEVYKKHKCTIKNKGVETK